MVRVQRLTIGIVIAVFAFFVASGIRGTVAQNAPAATPVPAPFTAGMLLQLKPNVPYAYLRSTASSNAEVVDTAHAGEFVIVLGDSARYDGVQWWWFVERGSGNLAGWIEQNSLLSALVPSTPTPNGQVANSTLAAIAPAAILPSVTPSATLLPPTAVPPVVIPLTNVPATLMPMPTTTATVLESVPTIYVTPTSRAPLSASVTPGGVTLNAAAISDSQTMRALNTTWPVGTRLILAPGVPFAWIRGAPSVKAYTRATVYPGYSWSILTVRETSPAFEGSQSWVLVNVPALNVFGWVEKQSLVVEPIPPTAVDTATYIPVTLMPVTLIPVTQATVTPFIIGAPPTLILITATPTTAQ